MPDKKELPDDPRKPQQRVSTESKPKVKKPKKVKKEK